MKSVVLLLACVAITVGYPVPWWTDNASRDRLTRRVAAYEDRDCYPFVTVQDEFDPYLSQSLTVDRPARETDAYQRMLADDLVLVPNRMYQWGIQEAPASPGQYMYAQDSPVYPQERVLLFEPKYYEPMFSPSAVSEQRASAKEDAREPPQDKMEEKKPEQLQLPRKQKQFKRQPVDDPKEHADQ